MQIFLQHLRRFSLLGTPSSMQGSLSLQVIFSSRFSKTLDGKAACQSKVSGHQSLNTIPAQPLVSLSSFSEELGDFIYHSIFGIEVDIEAFFSPTHLFLATGNILVILPPIYKAFRTNNFPSELKGQFPYWYSLTMLTSLLMYFSQFAHPFREPIAIYEVIHRSDPAIVDYTEFARDEVGVLGFIIMTIFFITPILLISVRWKLAPGSILFFTSFTSAAISSQEPFFQFVLVGISTGLLLELANFFIPFHELTQFQFWTMAFLSPILFTGIYYIILDVTIGILWSFHLISGTIVVSGLVGILAAFVVWPPQQDIINT